MRLSTRQYGSTHTLLLVFMIIGLHSVNGRVVHFAIYKKGKYYGPLTNERFLSIESVKAYYLRTKFLTEASIPVELTNQLIPDK